MNECPSFVKDRHYAEFGSDHPIKMDRYIAHKLAVMKEAWILVDKMNQEEWRN